jgi:hypothetical protein
MNDVILPQIYESVIHVLNYRICLCFLEYFLELESIFEVPLVTQLRDNVAVAIRSENLVTPQHAWMIQFFQNLDLLEQ